MGFKFHNTSFVQSIFVLWLPFSMLSSLLLIDARSEVIYNYGAEVEANTIKSEGSTETTYCNVFQFTSNL